MKIFKNRHKLQKEIVNIKDISFIPTMGGLHKGHVSLINKSKNYKGKVLVSIFVNPTQFNKKIDFNNYPRNLKRDLNILKKLHVDFIYIPSFKDILLFKTKKKVFINKFSKILCGKYRKGHFEGVLNIINRFLEIICPKYIFLGEKDMQQIFLINSHILKRKINTKIIFCKTIRENNGVAFSTRNKNLDKKQFKIASKVFNYFKNNKKIFKKDLSNFNKILIHKHLKKLGVTTVDYIDLLNPITLKKPKNGNDKFNIFFAYNLKKIRLIDNI